MAIFARINRQTPANQARGLILKERRTSVPSRFGFHNRFRTVRTATAMEILAYVRPAKRGAPAKPVSDIPRSTLASGQRNANSKAAAKHSHAASVQLPGSVVYRLISDGSIRRTRPQ